MLGLKLNHVGKRGPGARKPKGVILAHFVPNDQVPTCSCFVFWSMGIKGTFMLQDHRLLIPARKVNQVTDSHLKTHSY